MRQKLSSWTIVLLLSSILWLGFSQAAAAKDKLSPANQRHIIERLSFGATSGQLKQIKSRGIESYIQSQLNPQSVTESSALNKYLATLSSIAPKPIELQTTICPLSRKNQRSTATNPAKTKNTPKKSQIYGQR